MFRYLLRNQLFFLGAITTIITVFVAVAAPLVASHDPLKTNPIDRLSPPSAKYIMGTDHVGRDIFSRAVYGSRASIYVGLSVVLLTTLAGGLLGLVSGYFRQLDGLIMRIMDGLMAFPSILLAIAVVAILGPNQFNVVLALAITYLPTMVRIVRGAVLGIRELDYITAAQAIGSSNSRIIGKHILPNTIAPIIVQSTFIMAVAILAEAGLSFIGVGTQPPTPSWGNMLSDGRLYVYQAWWITVFPGLFLVICVIGLNLLGDGLRDYLDPRLKGS